MIHSNMRWLFFDMGGVILDDGVVEQQRQSLLLDIGRKYRPNTTMDDVYRAWLEASKIPGSLRMNALSVLLYDTESLTLAEAEYRERCTFDYHALSRIRPEATSVLERLSKKYSLGIMANQHVKTLDIIEEAGLLPYFSHQKLSMHLGLEKPDPNFYFAILADTQADARTSVLIDDNWYRGLATAQAMGMQTILFEREFIPYPDDARPDYRIRALEELLTIFL